MKIELNEIFASNATVDGFDVRQMKKALNRLGYYMPPKDAGITDIADGGVFMALKQYQAENGLKATGAAKPGDDTVAALNGDLEKKREGKYIWRTTRDDKVRPEHAELEGSVRSYEDSLLPGDDIGCRCWEEKIEEKPEGLWEILISEVRDAERKWTWADAVNHFYNGGGQEVSLEETGYLQDVIDKVHERLFKTLASQITAVVQDTGEGDFDYDTSNSYPWLSEVFWVFGGGTIRTSTQGSIVKDGKFLSVEGTIDYEYDDVYTDPINLRKKGKEKTSEVEGIDEIRLKETDLGGTLFPILGSWQTKLTGSVLAK